MESRMTICNMSIEMGARGGLIAPDETTVQYLKKIPLIPGIKDIYSSVNEWEKLCSDPDAVFEQRVEFRCRFNQTNDHLRYQPRHGNGNRCLNS